ncbi:MAG: hypothetical protein AAFY71_28735 [Bacteroidota bacterium]
MELVAKMKSLVISIEEDFSKIDDGTSTVETEKHLDGAMRLAQTLLKAIKEDRELQKLSK